MKGGGCMDDTRTLDEVLAEKMKDPEFKQAYEALESGVCGCACEVYSRVVGYLRPVKQWNVGKRAEYAQRREFRAPALDDPQLVERINAAMVRRFGGF